MANIKYIDLNGLGEAVKKIKEKADAAYAGKDHEHVMADVTDLQAAMDEKVDKVDNHSLVADADIAKIHEHTNKTELDKVVDGKVDAWDAKVGVNDLDKLVFSNQGLSQAQNAKAAIDALIQVNVDVVNDIQALEQAVGKAADADAQVEASGLHKLIADGDADVLEAAKQDAANQIAALVDSAPDAMNTLKELADAIGAHQTVYEGYVQTVNGQVAAAQSAAEAKAAELDGALADRIQALEDAEADELIALSQSEIEAAINNAWV